MQAVQEDHLPDTCTRKRPTYTTNEIGEATVTWATATVACRISSRANMSSEVMPGGGEERLTKEFAWVPVDSDVERGDHLIRDSVEYTVSGIEQSSWPTARKLYLERVS